MKTRDIVETTNILNSLADENSWLIDGFGSLEVMEKRFIRAEQIIFIDFPIWGHYWWCIKRQVYSIWVPRSELPAGCNEATLSYTFRLFKILWRVHTQIKPKLIHLFNKLELKDKVIRVSTVEQWNRIFNNEY